MTYDQADNILSDKQPDDPNKPQPPPLTAGSKVKPKLIKQLKNDLTLLTTLARKKKKEREDIGGAVDLSSGDIGNELKFTLDSGIPIKVAVKVPKEIHDTIAELMILGNTSVAQKIYNYFPNSALLRIHRNVQDNKLEELHEVLKATGLELYGSDNKSLAKTLNEAQKNIKSNVVKSLVKSITTSKLFKKKNHNF